MTADRALRVIGNLLRVVEPGDPDDRMQGGGVYISLLDAHPPFQIDGQTSASPRASRSCCCRSHRDALDLLPALPAAWTEGSVSGLRARGGFQVDVAWQDGALREVRVESLLGNPLRLRWRGWQVDTATEAGRDYRFAGPFEGAGGAAGVDVKIPVDSGGGCLTRFNRASDTLPALRLQM